MWRFGYQFLRDPSRDQFRGSSGLTGVGHMGCSRNRHRAPCSSNQSQAVEPFSRGHAIILTSHQQHRKIDPADVMSDSVLSHFVSCEKASSGSALQGVDDRRAQRPKWLSWERTNETERDLDKSGCRLVDCGTYEDKAAHNARVDFGCLSRNSAAVRIGNNQGRPRT